MKEYQFFIIDFVTFVLFVCLLHYFYWLARKPYKIYTIAKKYNKNIAWKTYAFVPAIALIIFSYNGFMSLITWIPENISVNYGGEDYSIKQLISATLSICSCFVYLIFYDVSEIKIINNRNKLLLTYIYDILRASLSIQLLKAIELKIEKDRDLIKDEEDKKTINELLEIIQSNILYSEKIEKEYNVEKNKNAMLEKELKNKQSSTNIATHSNNLQFNILKEETDLQIEKLSEENDLLVNKMQIIEYIASIGCIRIEGNLVENGLAQVEKYPYFIDNEIIMSTMANLDTIFSETIKPSKEDISKGKSHPYSISGAIDKCKSTYLVKDANIFAAYSGNSHGGNTEYYGEDKLGEKLNIKDVLRFQLTQEGLIEAQFFATHINKYGHSWHGAYARFSTYITNHAFIKLLSEKFDKEDIIKAKNLLSGKQPGVLVSKIDNHFSLSSLCFSPTTGLFEMIVNISNDGKIINAESIHIVKTNQMVLY